MTFHLLLIGGAVSVDYIVGGAMRADSLRLFIMSCISEDLIGQRA